MKKFYLKLFCIILIFLIIFSSANINVNAAGTGNNTTGETTTNKEEDEAKQNAIKNIAMSYYYKGEEKAIQYDHKRRLLNVKAEEAKKNTPVYLDCSSFVYNVYRQAFDKDYISKKNIKLSTTAKLLNEAAKSEENKDYIVYYKKLRDSGKYDKLNENNFEKNLKKVKVGDLIVVETNRAKFKDETNVTRGHVYMVLGVPEDSKGNVDVKSIQLIHCTGSTYDYSEFKDKYENENVIKIDTVKNILFNENSSGYIYKNNNDCEDKIIRIGIIRPLKSNAYISENLTEYAKVKNLLPDLSIELQSNIAHTKTVKGNKELRFTLKLKNNGKNDIKDINVKQTLSENLDIVNSESNVTKVTKGKDGKEKKSTSKEKINYDKQSRELSFTIKEITSETTITIQYATKVKGEDIATNIIESVMKVGKENKFISTNKIKHTIIDNNKTYKINELNKKNITNETNTRKWIADNIYNNNTVVQETLNNVTVSGIFNNVMDITQPKFKKEKNNTSEMLVDGMYKLKEINITNNKNFKKANLKSGDIIIYNYHKKNNSIYGVYLYSNDKLFYVGSTEKENKKKIKDSTVEKVLENIIANCDSYAVLRPINSIDTNKFDEKVNEFEGKEYTSSNRNGKGATRYFIDDVYKKYDSKLELKFKSKTTRTRFDELVSAFEKGTITLKDKKSIEEKYYKNIHDMIVPELYGYNLNRYKNVKPGLRYLRTNNLMVGDIIIYKNLNGKYGVYLYIGDDQLAYYYVSTDKTDKKDKTYKIITKGQETLDKLIGYEVYAVLRPSLLISKIETTKTK